MHRDLFALGHLLAHLPQESVVSDKTNTINIEDSAANIEEEVLWDSMITTPQLLFQDRSDMKSALVGLLIHYLVDIWRTLTANTSLWLIYSEAISEVAISIKCRPLELVRRVKRAVLNHNGIRSSSLSIPRHYRLLTTLRSVGKMTGWFYISSHNLFLVLFQRSNLTRLASHHQCPL